MNLLCRFLILLIGFVVILMGCVVWVILGIANSLFDFIGCVIDFGLFAL